MGKYRPYGQQEEPELEEVAQFLVSLEWGNQRYYGDTTVLDQGLRTCSIVIEGVATSTQAIARAMELLKSVREDEPRESKAELRKCQRPKAKVLLEVNGAVEAE